MTHECMESKFYAVHFMVAQRDRQVVRLCVQCQGCWVQPIIPTVASVQRADSVFTFAALCRGQLASNNENLELTFLEQEKLMRRSIHVTHAKPQNANH